MVILEIRVVLITYKVLRIHQLNGPDYWQADCYMLDHTFQSMGLTQQKALDNMYARVEAVAFQDWNMAHMINNHVDFMRERQLALQAEIANRATIPEPENKKGLFNKMVRYITK